MTLQTKLWIAGGILLAIAAIAGARSWIDEHDARLKAEATVAAEQKAFALAGEQLKTLQEGDKARDAQAAVTIAQLTAAAASVKTPQQITNWIPAQLGPNLPAPVTAVIPPTTHDDPSPDAVFSVPQADLPILRDTIAKCQTNAVALSGAQGDLSSCRKQLDLKDAQIDQVEHERDAYKEELKGGTFWHRVWKGTKKVGIGAAIAAAAICVSGHCQ